MKVEKTEENKLTVSYETDEFKLSNLDKDFVGSANKINSGKISIPKMKAKFQKKLKMKTDNKVTGDVWEQAVEDIFSKFAVDYGVAGYAEPLDN